MAAVANTVYATRCKRVRFMMAKWAKWLSALQF